MNREDIIRMATEAGFHDSAFMAIYTGRGSFLERFAVRVAAAAAAAEREAIAKMFDGPVFAYDYREIASAIRARGTP